MNHVFASLLRDLPAKLEQLLASSPVRLSDSYLRSQDKSGVYLFTENERHLYVGRTKRSILTRVRNHVSTAKDCPFAFRLARESSGRLKASYGGAGTRKQLLQDQGFASAYEEAKNRIRNMDVRWVVEPDPLKQCLLEIYVAVTLATPYNDFDTH